MKTIDIELGQIDPGFSVLSLTSSTTSPQPSQGLHVTSRGQLLLLNPKLSHGEGMHLSQNSEATEQMTGSRVTWS